MNTENNRTKVEEVLRRVSEECLIHRALVLTESDLKCQIYMRLVATQEFGNIEETFDSNITSSPIHTETKFFDKNGVLRQAPDY